MAAPCALTQVARGRPPHVSARAVGGASAPGRRPVVRAPPPGAALATASPHPISSGMMRMTTRMLRYARSWVTGRGSASSREVTIMRDGRPLPATLVTPFRRRSALPGWIVLHGVTRPGRAHAQLVRFTQALASTGCAVLVPEVPEWRRLDLAPGVTAPTVRGSLEALRRRPEVGRGRRGLIGFSFGAPQALVASADPTIGPELAGVVGFGGYCDLEETLRFMFLGTHEWRGRRYTLRPDPYGRWIVGANYLTDVPGYEAHGDVARALWTLAAAAGDHGAPAWDPRYRAMAERLRQGIAAPRRPLFDTFVSPSRAEEDRPALEDLVERLGQAVRRVDRLMDPADALRRVRHDVHLLHGRHDHLIPFSETLRTRACLPHAQRVAVTVTRLFGHSAQDPFPGPIRGLGETLRFLRALGRMLAVA